ncbi:hypothetical protein [Candidatus Nitrotoga sp. 1052]|uniref:hypothetical protein n=1 Tax=Candidatus Nitrotoga sp. 1052 TaxID=2886964 RepID=UPI001EF60657|nr:hypothetical protein [Candidatus Nitrotoga sp. 1052]CAH1073192.1 hypothetical protein NTG1052_20008 [Candidatus Nitrotoga sp. 1052]
MATPQVEVLWLNIRTDEGKSSVSASTTRRRGQALLLDANRFAELGVRVTVVTIEVYHRRKCIIADASSPVGLTY